MFSLSVVWFAYDLIVSGCRVVVKLLVRELIHTYKLRFVLCLASLVKRVPVNTANEGTKEAAHVLASGCRMVKGVRLNEDKQTTIVSLADVRNVCFIRKHMVAGKEVRASNRDVPNNSEIACDRCQLAKPTTLQVIR